MSEETLNVSGDCDFLDLAHESCDSTSRSSKTNCSCKLVSQTNHDFHSSSKRKAKISYNRMSNVLSGITRLGWHRRVWKCKDDTHKDHPIVSHPKTLAIEKKRFKTLAECALHLFPVVLSAAVLSLNFSNLYWLGASQKYVNEYRSALQIFAKLHEIFVTISLSKVALYYLRWILTYSEDSSLPHGLFTTIYLLSQGGAPFNCSIFSAIRGSWHGVRQARKSTVVLFLMAIILATLSLAIGRSSAIVVLPRLRWWNSPSIWTLYNSDQTAFDNQKHLRSTNDFSIYIPKNIFPTNLTENSLPIGCENLTVDAFRNCPYAGLTDFPELGQAALRAESIINISLGQKPARSLSTSWSLQPSVDELVYGFWSTSQVPSFVLTDHLGAVVSLVHAEYSIRRPDDLKRHQKWSDRSPLAHPQLTFTLELQTNHNRSFSPYVQVACIGDSPQKYIRNLTAVRSLLEDVGPPVSLTPADDNMVLLDIRSIWPQEMLDEEANNITKVHFQTNQVSTADPLDTFAFVFNTHHMKPPSLDICIISTHWMQTSPWIQGNVIDPITKVSGMDAVLTSSLRQ